MASLLKMEKETRNILLLYISCCIMFNAVLGLTTIMWFIGWFLNLVLMFISVILLVIAFTSYRNSNYKRAKVLLVVFSIFWISYIGQDVMKYQIEKSGEQKGEMLVKRLEEYKAVKNRYPENINNEYFEYLDLRYKFKSKVKYEYLSDDDFIVKFRAFDGMYKIYGESGVWFYDDG